MDPPRSRSRSPKKKEVPKPKARSPKAAHTKAASPPSPNIAPPRVPPHYYNPPPGVFRSPSAYNNAVRNRGIESPGFSNAKNIAMLERGWREMNINEFDVKLEGGYRRSTELVKTDILVLFSEYDGPEYEAKLVSFQAGSDRTRPADHKKDKFTFQSLDSTNEWSYTIDEIIGKDITIYIKTDPVPFTYTIDQARAKQQGGFYPSVYGGITGAKMLTPLIARQMMRMYEHVGHKPLATKTRKHKRKSKSKKLSRNKRA